MDSYPPTPSTNDPLEPEASTQEATADQSRSSSAKSLIFVIGGALLAAGLLWYFLIGNNSSGAITFQEPATVLGSQIQPDRYPEVVAIVNGESVPRGAFLNNLASLEQEAMMQGVDVTASGTLALMEKEALNRVVSVTLLEQAASKSTITITDDMVDAEMLALETRFGGQAGLDQELTELGMTREGLRSDVVRQLRVTTYVDQTILADLPEVSEADMQAFYADLTASGSEIPPYEEISSQLELQLQEMQRGTAIADAIEVLRAEAVIESQLQ